MSTPKKRLHIAILLARNAEVFLQRREALVMAKKDTSAMIVGRISP